MAALKAVCSFMLLDGDEKDLRQKTKDYGYSADLLHMPMLPGTSGTNRKIWWSSAAALYNNLTPDNGKLLYWGSGRFFNTFLRESSKWDHSIPCFWSNWDRTVHRGVSCFNGALGLYLPRDAASIITSLPSWIGNRFLSRIVEKKLFENKILLSKKGKDWPSPKEELKFPKGRQRITLVMIVKNEENFIAGCFEQALPFIDDIIVVDTGSDDETVNIAKLYEAKIIRHTWKNDFAAARNAYMDALPDGYVFSLDADEYITPETGVAMRLLAEREEQKVWYFNTYNYVSEELSRFNLHTNVRLFYKDKRSIYKGLIHEQLESPLEKVSVTDTAVLHYGYLDKIVKLKDKAERNTNMLEQATKVQGTAFDYFNKGIAMMAYLKYQDAYDSFTKYFEMQDENLLRYYPSAYWQAARAAVQIGKLEQALKLADKACESNLAEAFFVRACILDDRSELDKAVEDYVKACESNESTDLYKMYNLLDPSIKIWRASFMAGSVLEKLNRFAEAEIRYKLSHEGEKSNPVPLLALARISRKLEKYPQALEWSKKALAVSEDAFDTDVEHTEALIALGRFDETFEFAERVTKASPVYSAIFLKIAEILRTGGKLDLCCKALERYLQYSPENYDIIVMYARCLTEDGSPKKALEVLDREWPEDLTVELTQKIMIVSGFAHHLLGDDLQALGIYTSAFEIGEDNQELLFKIALSMVAVDRLEDALAALDRIVVVSPDYPGCKELLDLIRLKAAMAI